GLAVPESEPGVERGEAEDGADLGTAEPVGPGGVPLGAARGERADQDRGHAGTSTFGSSPARIGRQRHSTLSRSTVTFGAFGSGTSTVSVPMTTFSHTVARVVYASNVTAPKSLT